MNPQITSERPHFKTRSLDSALELSIALPGVIKDQIQIDLQERLLVISAERKPLEGQFKNNEDEALRFELKIELHQDLDPSSITATHRNGILTLQLQKHKELAPRKIDILAN